MSSSIRHYNLSGCGDGIEISKKSKTPYSTPLKSSVAISAKTPLLKFTQKKNTIPVQGKKKVKDLATHPNITRRRSLTLAEFNLAKTVKQEKLPLTPLPILEVSVNNKLEYPKEKVAGLLVYQLLLLNSWRKRRTQALNLSESQKKLESQNAKLELQIEVLLRLRSAESEKRSEAIADVQNIQLSVEDNLNTNQILLKENGNLGGELQLSKDVFVDLQVQTKNAENDLMTEQFDLTTGKHKLETEQKTSKRLLREKHRVTSELSSMEADIHKLCNEIEGLEKQLLSTQLNLQDVIFNNDNYQCKNMELLGELSAEILKKKLLEEENEQLKSNLVRMETILAKELQRDVLKNVNNLAATFFGFLKTVMVLMLPIIPK